MRFFPEHNNQITHEQSQLVKCRETYNNALALFNQKLKEGPKDKQQSMLEQRPVMADLEECKGLLKALIK